MQTVVGVRFKTAGKIYYFGQGILNINEGDYVIVETSQGMECGRVVTPAKDVAEDAYPSPLRMVHRIADSSDLARIEDNNRRLGEIRHTCEEKIREHGLDMKLVDVEITFDLSKIIFSFTADGRVDFRGLVRDLAGIFRTRIELRQIGVRDEARLLGGMGCCGRPLCCATFLSDFAQVSIRMAKDQNLSLNPQKISGICGRLMCCLKYENDNYCDRSDCPKRKEETPPPVQGSMVVTSDGEGKVIAINAMKRMATILLNNGRTVMLSWDDILEEVVDAENIIAHTAIEQNSDRVDKTGSNKEHAHGERKPRPKKSERKSRRHRANMTRGNVVANNVIGNDESENKT